MDLTFRKYRIASFLWILGIAFLAGCGANDGVDELVSHPPKSRPQGIVQTRTLEGGMPHLALMMAPSKPGLPELDLRHLRGSLFTMVDDAVAGADSGIRGRLNPDRDNYLKPSAQLRSTEPSGSSEINSAFLSLTLVLRLLGLAPIVRLI